MEQGPWREHDGGGEADRHPGSDRLGGSAGVDKALLADQRMQLTAKQKTPQDIDKYFHDLADKFAKGSIGEEPHPVYAGACGSTYEKDPVKGW